MVIVGGRGLHTRVSCNYTDHVSGVHNYDKCIGWNNV